MSSQTTSGITTEQVRTTCLLVLAVLAAGAALAWLRAVVVPLLLAFALFFILSPISDWLTNRRRWPTWAAAGGAMLVGLLSVALVSVLVATSLAEVGRESASLTDRLRGLNDDPIATRVAEWFGITSDPETGQLFRITPEKERELTQSVVGWAKDQLGTLLLMLAFLLFLMLGQTRHGTPAPGMASEAARRVRRYLVEMFAFSVLTGVLVGIILALLGVRFALLFGFLAFVLNFIPTLGPIAATLLPVPVVLLDASMPVWAKVSAVVLPGLVQVVVGNVIQPRFQSRTQDLHPVASMTALVVFGMLWGPVGAVLAVPMLGVMKIAFERIPGGRPFADLLSGRLDQW